MSTAAKQEFFRWIESIDPTKLNEIECKLLNLLVNNIDKLAPLSTANGKRAKELNDLIQKHHTTISSNFPDLSGQQATETERYDQLIELNIGPFRGFTKNEAFVFDKKYTFMHGPNGSGKSSFCEGLEYALLGGIEEADAKRIDPYEYIKNIQKNRAVAPTAFSKNSSQQKIKIPQNQALYRFAFVEKNRIDGFARITAITASVQKDRIATLFGLDSYSSFVDGFTDDIERYLIPSATKFEAFKIEHQKNEEEKNRITTINTGLASNILSFEVLLKDVAQKNVNTIEELKIFLNGDDGVSGYINELQKQKAENIPDNLKTDSLELLPITLLQLHTDLKFIGIDLQQLSKLSTDVNYQRLYETIQSIEAVVTSEPEYCPACKTPLDQVAVNPFENAKIELSKLNTLSELQTRIQKTANSILNTARIFASNLKAIQELCTASRFTKLKSPTLSEFNFTTISTIENWKQTLETELHEFEGYNPLFEELKETVIKYNTTLSAKRALLASVDTELKKYQVFNARLQESLVKGKSLTEEMTVRQKKITNFQSANASKLKEIEEERQKIVLQTHYANAYNSLISNLKKKRDLLPLRLSAWLSEKVMDYYNTINAHDPEFELLESLSLPVMPGAKFEIKFKGDTRAYNALLILSEGHIKVLGLSILLAKAVNENLGFLIFDDIVNAIDDDHRSGIADLLLCHDDLKSRQHILTCHGESFVNTLEHKLGTSMAGKLVKNYRFIPAVNVPSRGVQVSIGNSKHYLLKAKEYLNQGNLRDSATDCRRAVESISYQLWKKLDKQLKVNLKVTMRAPGIPPDLATVVESLIKELARISGTVDLQRKLTELKSKYPWSLLNKGVHEDDAQPEFEHKDITELIILVELIETQVAQLKLSVINAEEISK